MQEVRKASGGRSLVILNEPLSVYADSTSGERVFMEAVSDIYLGEHRVPFPPPPLLILIIYCLIHRLQSTNVLSAHILAICATSNRHAV